MYAWAVIFAPMEERNDIVIYQSEDGLVKMEAMVDPLGDTIWATQKAIAALFGVTIPNVSYHFRRIFESGELKRDTVIKEYLNTAQSGARGLSEEKAAMMLYLVVKNHSFVDGNKRISDASLVALTLMIAESHAEEMNTIVKVVVSLINKKN